MIGEPLNRLDGRLKVTGGTRYSAEWPIEGVTYGVLVQSTIAKGTITAFDLTAALAVPGVLRIFTADSAPKLPQAGRAGVNPPGGRVLSLLQDRVVHYNGEPIGLVVAETFEQATEAALLVRAAYQVDPPAVDMAKAVPSAPEYTGKINGAEPAHYRGDVPAGLAAADAVIDQTYTTPLETHNALEPHATIAQWENGRLTLYDSTQYLYGVKRFVAKTMGVTEDAVRVVSKFVGGAFGSKGSAWSHVVLAAMAARELSRPVKVVLTRRQMFGIVGARPYTVQRLAVGAKADGTLTAIRQEVVSSTSTMEDWVEGSTMQTRMLYVVPNVATTQRLARLNVGTPTFNRGPGESSGTFGLESALDELAEKLHLDPIELRLKNYAEADPENGKPWSSKSLRECYAKGAERIDWSRRRQAPGTWLDGGWLAGLGMSTATYPAKRQRASATAALTADATIVIQAATHELGGGTSTVMTQIACDILDVPPERIRFELGDSTMPENPISAGSMTAASSGPAVRAAAVALRDKLKAMGAEPSSVDACVQTVRQNGGQPIEARGTAEPDPSAAAFSSHSFGAVFAEVRDPDLGQIRVVRLVGAYGVGRILNLKTAHSQIHGGLIYGMAMALHERTVIDTRSGRYLNSDLSEYLVPTNRDTPAIDVIFADENDPYVNPIGAKGIGEIGTTGVAAAIANAVHNATGIRVRDLPITLDKVLTL